jgi:hypothetical protein
MNHIPIDDMHWVQTAKNLWLSNGINLEAGSQLKDIEATESAVGLRRDYAIFESYGLLTSPFIFRNIFLPFSLLFRMFINVPPR